MTVFSNNFILAAQTPNITTVDNLAVAPVSGHPTQASLSWDWGFGSGYYFNVGQSVSSPTGPFTALTPTGQIGFGFSEVYLVTGLLPSTTYYFEVASVDSAGSVGPFTVSPSITTGAGVVPSVLTANDIAVDLTTPNQMRVTIADNQQAGTQPVTYAISTATAIGGPFTLQQSGLTNNSTTTISVPG